MVTVLERGGKVRSRHVEKVTAKNLHAVINEVCEEDAHVMTDTGVLRGMKDRKHSLVNHKADSMCSMRKACASPLTPSRATSRF